MIRLPGAWPKQVCFDRSKTLKNTNGWHYVCTRRHSHGGRHAHVWWDLGGRVRAVWGERDG
jgi:hypothetical protein